MTRTALLVVAGLLAATPDSAAQQIQSRPVQRSALPRQAAIQGNLVLAREWTDRAGRNLLVLSRTEKHPTRSAGRSPDEGFRDRELFAYHYVQRNGQYTLLWTTTDFVRECDLDMSLAFEPRSVAITDLDEDGTAETSFMYILGCHGGVDPHALKLIMHEGATKYAIRGSTDLTAEIGAENGTSRMTIDPAFAAAPAPFRAFALRQWNRFKRQAEWSLDD